MSKNLPRTIRLEDYAPPPYLIDTTALLFDLDETSTVVTATLGMRVNPAAGHSDALRLHGQSLELVSITLDGRALADSEYSIDDSGMTINNVPDAFELVTRTRIYPAENTSLEGLYLSSGNYCTQCEAEGFRRITWYLDRPDVMARFKVEIHADKTRYPVLLSNGNLVGSGDLEDNRHWAIFEDPFAKPSYLFALVAGNLAVWEDRFTTKSGRVVALSIYVQQHNLDRCEHAMTSLRQAMQWDEDVFGLECDLDDYKIVAVDDFNMGAMENKGLNVFNSACILARPETATDADYHNIQSIIGHEYFHNWTGNRVTCRDWFQLSLKEGLTVFRDQEFSSDMASRPVQRVADVRILRSAQFAEDSGPMAHPVRPASYIEISNFYTATIYNKGAEVIRMYQTLLGAEVFRRGMATYIERHDGQAVTTDEFAQAMADESGHDLEQFKRWYSQAGTPVLQAESTYDEQASTWTLTVAQHCPPTPGQKTKEPFALPLTVALLDSDGVEMTLRLEGEEPGAASTEKILQLTESSQTFRFVDIRQQPVPSLLRNFSAPVKLEYAYSDADYCFLLAHDTDPFNRWEAGQQLGARIILGLVNDVQAGSALHVDAAFIEACGRTLLDESLDQALIAETLTLPAETWLAQMMDVIDVDAIHTGRLTVMRALAEGLHAALLETYNACVVDRPYEYDQRSAARRSLKNLCLAYLLELDDSGMRELALRQFDNADNMTDSLGAMRILAHIDCDEREQVLAAFYERWHDDALVLDKWFAIQAVSRRVETLDEVRSLLSHSAFDMRNPNKVRSLIGSFCIGNPVRFHAADGSGYRFLSECVLELDPVNPQITARLLGAFSRWRQYDPGRQTLMKEQLERIVGTTGLSRDSYEIAIKSLGES